MNVLQLIETIGNLSILKIDDLAGYFGKILYYKSLGLGALSRNTS